MRSLFIAPVAALLIAALAACTEDVRPPGTTRPDTAVFPDATTDEDAGPPNDATAGDTGSPLDSGEPDAGLAEDAGELTDSGPEDTGAPEDAGDPDASQLADAEPADAQAADGAPQDAAAPDAAPADAGAPDANVPPDAGTPDSGVPPAPACNPTFGMANACGGLPFGTWTYRAACSDVTPFASVISQCPGSSVSNVSRTASGTLAINSPGTFVRNLTTITQGDAYVPSSCFPGGVTCSTLPFLLPTIIPNASATCINATNGCNCHVVVNEQLNDSGSITVNGGVATTNSGGAQRSYWFCAAGSSFEYRGLANNPSDNENVYVLTP